MAGKSNKGAMRLLDLRGQVWWFKRAIPLSCRPAFQGVTTYLLSLETPDVRVAKARRDEVEVETARLFAAARAGKPPSGLSPAERGALWRATLGAITDDRVDDREFRNDVDAWEVGQSLSDEEMEPDAAELARYAEEAERESLSGGPRVAFENARLGRVSVTEHLEAYLSAAKLAPKTRKARRGLVNHFARWCDGENLTLDKIDRKAAGRYVTQMIDPMHPKTAAEHLLALRQYWIFLHVRGHIEESDEKGGPWHGQQLKDKSQRVERGSRDKERSFSAEEVRALLLSPCPSHMNREHHAQLVDAVKISLLSGMRMDEVLTLWVEEVHDGVFDIQQGKTAAAARKVPIHPELKELIEKRLRGKGPKNWLFHELEGERDPGDTFGKRFRRYRLKVGVDDKHEGKRRSLVNFHSARRWFITNARHADQPRETIMDVVGHRPNKRDITYGIYTKGASAAQRLACVEAVQLPAWA